MDERTRDLLARGREAYEANDYDKAEPCLIQLVNEQRGFADVHDMLGVIYHHQGRLPEAVTMFEAALRLNPNYTEAALNLAVTFNDLGRYQEAKEVYSQALRASKSGPRKLDPFAQGKIANMHAEVGKAYDALGLYPDAVREYERALELCPHFQDIRTRLGTTLREMGAFPAALRELERVRTETPKYVPARLSLGLAYHALGRMDEAREEWEAAQGHEPANKSARMYLASLAARAHEPTANVPAGAELPGTET
jgi:tetratricopeptide (TPR) repeat protein